MAPHYDFNLPQLAQSVGILTDWKGFRSYSNRFPNRLQIDRGLKSSCGSGGRLGPQVRTCEEARLLQNDNWAEERCERILRKLESDAYVKKPFRKRSEYADLVLALIHSGEHSGQMSRMNKSATVETILRRAISLPNVEYLLNGSRYIAQRESSGDVARLPVGATMDEASDG